MVFFVSITLAIICFGGGVSTIVRAANCAKCYWWIEQKPHGVITRSVIFNMVYVIGGLTLYLILPLAFDAWYWTKVTASDLRKNDKVVNSIIYARMFGKTIPVNAVFIFLALCLDGQQQWQTLVLGALMQTYRCLVMWLMYITQGYVPITGIVWGFDAVFAVAGFLYMCLASITVQEVEGNMHLHRDLRTAFSVLYWVAMIDYIFTFLLALRAKQFPKKGTDATQSMSIVERGAIMLPFHRLLVPLFLAVDIMIVVVCVAFGNYMLREVTLRPHEAADMGSYSIVMQSLFK